MELLDYYYTKREAILLKSNHQAKGSKSSKKCIKICKFTLRLYMERIDTVPYPIRASMNPVQAEDVASIFCEKKTPFRVRSP